jgi:hypothetical protein
MRESKRRIKIVPKMRESDSSTKVVRKWRESERKSKMFVKCENRNVEQNLVENERIRTYVEQNLFEK